MSISFVQLLFALSPAYHCFGDWTINRGVIRPPLVITVIEHCGFGLWVWIEHCGFELSSQLIKSIIVGRDLKVPTRIDGEKYHHLCHSF